jgi:hypothetical protein
MLDWLFAKGISSIEWAVVILFIYCAWLHIQAMKQRKNVSNLWKTLNAYGIKPGSELGPRGGRISFWETWSGDME